MVSFDLRFIRPDKPEKIYRRVFDGTRYRSTNSWRKTITIKAKGQSLTLDPDKKTASIRPLRKKEVCQPIDEWLGLLDHWRKSEVEDLGEAKKEGRRVLGFRAEPKDVGQREVTIEAWVDPATSYPVEIKANYERHGVSMIYHNFVWNSELDESLFDLTIPLDYEVTELPEVLIPDDEPTLFEPEVERLISLGGRFNWADIPSSYTISSTATEEERLRHQQQMLCGGVFNRPCPEISPTLENTVRLSFFGSRISNPDLRYLKRMDKLLWLTFDGGEISDEGLIYVRELHSLRDLGLENTAVTDDGLIYLQNLSNMTYLSLDDTNITDAGLKHLYGTNLIQIDLRGSKVTEEGITEIKRAMTSLKIVRY